MRVRDRSQAVDNQALARVREHWATKLETTCHALARTSSHQIISTRVSQQGCGVPDEARLVGMLAESLARELGLVADVRPTSNRLSVVFARQAAL